MINRILIRIKVLQILYAYYQNGTNDLKVAEKELLFSLQKSYDLYHYLLLLIIDLTNLQNRILDNRKHKYRPTEEEKNPNMRMVNNRFVAQLSKNEALNKYISESKISWSNDPDFVKSILDLILASDAYSKYLANPDDSYATDREFWRAVFKRVICGNDMIMDYLEDKSLYWNDDIEIVETFVLKTIKRFEESEGSRQELLPMFKDQEDRMFAVVLFREAILHKEVYRERVDKHIKNWEAERIIHMDLLIMQLALAEIVTFPSIPVSVSMNEYINIAKFYSTPKSAIFINGILNSVVDELKKEKVLFKN